MRDMLILAGGGRSMGDRMPGVRSGTEMPPNTNAGCVCVCEENQGEVFRGQMLVIWLHWQVETVTYT